MKYIGFPRPSYPLAARKQAQNFKSIRSRKRLYRRIVDGKKRKISSACRYSSNKNFLQLTSPKPQPLRRPRSGCPLAARLEPAILVHRYFHQRRTANLSRGQIIWRQNQDHITFIPDYRFCSIQHLKTKTVKTIRPLVLLIVLVISFSAYSQDTISTYINLGAYHSLLVRQSIIFLELRIRLQYMVRKERIVVQVILR